MAVGSADQAIQASTPSRKPRREMSDTRFAFLIGSFQITDGRLEPVQQTIALDPESRGLPAPELFPVEHIRAAAERVLGECGAKAFQYGVSEGIAPLREQIAAEMSRRSVACAADDILITTGSQQGLDLLLADRFREA